MNKQDMRTLDVVRRISQAGLADCRRAIRESKGDICLALRTLMSDEQIRIAITDRRIRENDPRQSVSGRFARQEGKILARLDAMLRVESGAAHVVFTAQSRPRRWWCFWRK